MDRSEVKYKKIKNISNKQKIFIACIVIILLIIGAFIVAKIGYDMCFKRAGFGEGTYASAQYSDTIQLRYHNIDANQYPRKQIEFKSGKNTLRGHIYGENNTKGLVVISHGLGAGSEGYLSQILYFVDKGWCVLAYDNTGSYLSDGKSTKGIAQSVLDLHAALDFVESDAKLAVLPKVLYGHSWGGYAVAAVLNYGHDIKAVCSVAGFASPSAALYDFAENKTSIFGVLAYPFFWGYHCSLFGENSNISAIDSINKTNIPVMLIHGTQDKTIRYNKSGIISNKYKITNPNVVYITRDKDMQNGHVNLVYDEKASAYINEIQNDVNKLHDKYGSNIPDNVLRSFYAEVNKELSSRLDEELFEDINNTYEKACNLK